MGGLRVMTEYICSQTPNITYEKNKKIPQLLLIKDNYINHEKVNENLNVVLIRYLNLLI